MMSMILVCLLAAPSAETPAVPPELLKARLEVAEKGYATSLRLFHAGDKGIGVEAVALWSRRILEAKRPLCKDRKEEAAVAQEHLERLKALEERAQKLFAVGTSVTSLDLLAVGHHRVEAEILLAQLKGK